MTEADAAVMSRILLYGCSLDAYNALAHMEAKGAAEPKVLFCAPSQQRPPILDVLAGCADALGLDLPQPRAAALMSAVRKPGTLMLTVQMQVWYDQSV
jgi:hypothetical protein